MVSEGPAACEAAHVLFFPQQLRSRMKRRAFHRGHEHHIVELAPATAETDD